MQGSAEVRRWGGEAARVPPEATNSDRLKPEESPGPSLAIAHALLPPCSIFAGSLLQSLRVPAKQLPYAGLIFAMWLQHAMFFLQCSCHVADHAMSIDDIVAAIRLCT